MIQIYNYNIFPNDIDSMFRGGVHQASGNILANGKLYFRVLKLYFEIINKNVICADSQLPYLFQNFQRSTYAFVKIKHQFRSIELNYLYFIEAAIERCCTKICFKRFPQKIFYNDVFLQWSKSCRKAFISIADLINYRKQS